jgi:hypothetical protein
VQRIKRDDGGGVDTEFGQQGLGRGDLIRFLGEVDMGEDQGRIGSEGAEDLSRCPVVKRVETAAEGFAIKRDVALAGLGAGRMELDGMAAKHGFHRDGIKALKNVADRGVRRCAPPCQPKDCVQLGTVDVDKGDDTTI